MEKPKLYPVSEPGINSSNLDGSTEKSSSSPESKRNLELYQKLMSDIENEKIAQHGGFNFESVGTILQYGILSPEKKLDILGEKSGFYSEHMQHNAAKSWRKYFFDTIDGLIKKYGTQYVKENFDSLPAPVEIGPNGSEEEKEYNAKRAYRTIRELKDSAGPRLRYFLEKVIPPVINYYLENGEWEEGKIGSKRKISDGAAPSDTKLAQAIDTFVGVGLISSTPPQTLKKYIFEKNRLRPYIQGGQRSYLMFQVRSGLITPNLNLDQTLSTGRIWVFRIKYNHLDFEQLDWV